MPDRETPAALTPDQAAEAVQNTSPCEFASAEDVAEAREQNQQFSPPGPRANMTESR